MTDREKLIDVFMHLGRHIKDGDEYGICYSSDFVEAVETVLQMLKNGASDPRWIPVTERLPEEWVDVLVYTNKVAKARFYDGEWHGQGGRWANVTHWMPLPESPNMDGGAENA